LPEQPVATSVRLPSEFEDRLNFLAAQTGRRTIDDADSALAQLRKLDRQVARRIVGKALTGPLGAFWRLRVGD
jgi:predicted transcriptional regulator